MQKNLGKSVKRAAVTVLNQKNIILYLFPACAVTYDTPMNFESVLYCSFIDG